RVRAGSRQLAASDLRGLASARPGQPLPRAALGAAARADVDVPARTRATAGGRWPARPVHSNVVVARTGRRAVFLLILALLAGHGPVSPQAVPAPRPGPRAGAAGWWRLPESRPRVPARADVDARPRLRRGRDLARVRAPGGSARARPA